MVDEPRYGGATVRSRSGAPDVDLSSTRWTFDEEPDTDNERETWSAGRALREFVDRYGWRAYALPVLAIVTVFALMSTTRPSHKQTAPTGAGHNAVGQAPNNGGPPVASGTTQIKTDQPGANSQNEVLASDTLPKGGPYTVRGDGTFRVLPGTTPVVGHGTLHRYTVEVENGITGVDLTAFSHIVDTSLDNPRSWTGGNGAVALQRVDSGPVDFHVTLTSSMTVRSLCGYELQIETSCWAPDKNARVVLNVARWVRGDLSYVGDLPLYHIYMVNHESGHALGHMHSHVCLSDGLGPVMMQQTIGLKSVTGKICQANPWPYPPGAKDAPGVEAPDTPANNPRIP